MLNRRGGENMDTFNIMMVNSVTESQEEIKKIKLAMGATIDDFPRLKGEITDSPRIKRAIDTMGGGYLNFTTGKQYIIDEPIVLRRGVTIRGMGTMDSLSQSSAVIKLKDHANCSLLVTQILAGGTAADFMAIENIVFDGNAVNQDTEHVAVKFHGAWVGSWIDRVLIRNVYGPGISFDAGSDVQINHLWVIGCYTDGYGVELNPTLTAGQLGYLNFDHLYVENIMPASFKGVSSSIPRTNENARGKGILINRSASCIINELHMEGVVYGIDLAHCHGVHIANVTMTHGGHSDVADSAIIRALDDGTKVISVGGGAFSNVVAGYSFFKKVTGLTSNSYPDLADKPYTSGFVISRYDLSLPHTLSFVDVVNRLHLFRSGSFSPTSLNFSPTENKSTYGYIQAASEYIRFGSNMNQPGETPFIELRSTGNTGDRVNIKKPMTLPPVTSMNGIGDGVLVNLNGVTTLKQGGSTQSISTTKTGTSVPTVNADFIGQFYVDTTAKTPYIAVSTGTGASDWKAI